MMSKKHYDNLISRPFAFSVLHYLVLTVSCCKPLQTQLDLKSELHTETDKLLKIRLHPAFRFCLDTEIR